MVIMKNNTPTINCPQTSESSHQRQYALSPLKSDHDNDGSDDVGFDGGDDDGYDDGNDDRNDDCDHGSAYNYYEVSNPFEQCSGGFQTRPSIGVEQHY